MWGVLGKRRRLLCWLLTQAPLPLAYYRSSPSIYKTKPSAYLYRFSSVKSCLVLFIYILLLAVYRVKLRLFWLTGFFGSNFEFCNPSVLFETRWSGRNGVVAAKSGFYFVPNAARSCWGWWDSYGYSWL